VYCSWQTLAGASPSALTCDELSALLKGQTPPIVVDVRPAADFQRSRIAAAVSLPYDQLGRAPWPKDARLVLYCSGVGCALSHDAALNLAKQGYTDVRILQGGLKEWDLKGYPVLRDPNAETNLPKPGFEFPASSAFASTDVGVKELCSQMKKGREFFILDARPPREFAAGHLPQAHSLPLEQLSNRLSSIPKDAEIVVYDRVAERSRQAVAILQAAGLSAHMLSGGVSVWLASGQALSVGSVHE
jgi:rhodanese-related sulfurtransferase